MAKQQCITMTGTVTKALPNAMFNVILDENEMTLLCVINGKMRKNYIRVIEGDRVEVEISPYDLTRGRICKRL